MSVPSSPHADVDAVETDAVALVVEQTVTATSAAKRTRLKCDLVAMGPAPLYPSPARRGPADSAARTRHSLWLLAASCGPVITLTMLPQSRITPGAGLPTRRHVTPVDESYQLDVEDRRQVDRGNAETLFPRFAS